VVKALCNKTENRGFETWKGLWIFSIYLILPAALGPGVHSVLNKHDYQKQINNVSVELKAAGAYGWQPYHRLWPVCRQCWLLNISQYCRPSRPVTGIALLITFEDRPSDRRLPVKLVPSFADRRSDVVSVTDPYARIFDFLDWSRYFFFQVAPQLYSRGWVAPAPDPLLLRKCGSAWSRVRASGSIARNWPLDHGGGLLKGKSLGNPAYHSCKSHSTEPCSVP
jgi:hypothetical protein